MRAVTQAFLDAYNARDVAGVLAVLGRPFRYSDCGYTHHTNFLVWTKPEPVAKAEIAAWLRARFAERDRFVQAHIVVVGPTEGSSTGPLGIGIQALRISDSLRAQSRVVHLGAKIIPTQEDDRIAAVVLAAPSC
jgi:hypothetical protein